MTTDQKIIKNRLGLLELARQLGNVSQACKILGDDGQQHTASRPFHQPSLHALLSVLFRY